MSSQSTRRGTPLLGQPIEFVVEATEIVLQTAALGDHLLTTSTEDGPLPTNWLGTTGHENSRKS